MKNFLSYNESVSFSANEKLNNVLYNEGNAHAIVIFSNIFRTAEQEILLYAKNIFSNENEVTSSPNYITSLINFLEKENTQMKILLTEYNPENDNNILRENIIKYKDKIKIRINTNQSIKKGGEPIHFCIGDNRMYRLEYDTEARKAICNFNDITSCSKFISFFNQLFFSSSAQESFI